jgi:hypothetical protein
LLSDFQHPERFSSPKHIVYASSEYRRSAAVVGTEAALLLAASTCCNPAACSDDLRPEHGGANFLAASLYTRPVRIYIPEMTTLIFTAAKISKTKNLYRMTSSGMLRRVVLLKTDVSEELSASFIRSLCISS